MMVQKIWKYLKLYKQQCNLTVEGHRLRIELKGIDCGEITMKEVLLADRLNKILPA